MNELKKMNLTK